LTTPLRTIAPAKLCDFSHNGDGAFDCQQQTSGRQVLKAGRVAGEIVWPSRTQSSPRPACNTAGRGRNRTKPSGAFDSVPSLYHSVPTNLNADRHFTKRDPRQQHQQQLAQRGSAFRAKRLARSLALAITIRTAPIVPSPEPKILRNHCRSANYLTSRPTTAFSISGAGMRQPRSASLGHPRLCGRGDGFA
jgi:hypothetical protein